MPSTDFSADKHTQNAPNFTQWALAALRCDVQRHGEGVWQATLPEPLQREWGGSIVRFRAATNGRESVGEPANDPSVLSAECSSKLFRWTIERLRAAGPAVHAAPARQPAGVHELAPALFAAFDFPDGHVHLAGCTLEDRPVVRLTLTASENGSSEMLCHYFFWPGGACVEEELVQRLGLDELVQHEPRLAAPGDEVVRGWIAAAQRRLDVGNAEVVACTLIWCKYAEGKLAFSVDGGRFDEDDAGEATVAFEGWAALLADGSVKPPPFHCRLSGIDSYRLAATDEGQIAAAEAVAKCEETGRRVLAGQLETCAATGKQVVSELLENCRVSGERVLASQIVPCPQCNQRVSPKSLKAGRCCACRSLASIRKDDPRMARLLDEYPKLDRWSHWRIAETETNYILLASGWLRQLLLVADKQSLEVAHAAAAGRLLSSWQELPSGQREEWLG